MLPEYAWNLKHGERIVGTNLSGRKIEGTVECVLSEGCSYQEYIDHDFSPIDALRLQHDGPTIVMKVKGVLSTWRPDFVERVTGEHTIMCATCGVVVRVQLPLRFFSGEPPTDPIHAAMVKQSRCGSHVDIP